MGLFQRCGGGRLPCGFTVEEIPFYPPIWLTPSVGSVTVDFTAQRDTEVTEHCDETPTGIVRFWRRWTYNGVGALIGVQTINAAGANYTVINEVECGCDPMDSFGIVTVE